MKYEAVIGLEVHAQLLTESKIFCGCPTKFGSAPNTNVCPVCLGLPGALPVLNRKAVEYATRAALALNCEIYPRSIFARKNYFYPDLPKGYQISQYDNPLAIRGHVDLVTEGGERKRIGVHRLHLEEDAGKSLHDGFPDSDENTYVDYNRSGVPLVEIVSEPDMRSPREAYLYLQELKSILEFLEVCDCNMEEGSLRCDANVSIRPVGATELGTKTELKNMNSFRAVQKAIEYEVGRQVSIVESGHRVLHETLLWDEDRQITLPMRGKEEAYDYRYFTEPDLLPLEVPPGWQESIRSHLPELPAAMRARFENEYQLGSYDVGVLTSSKELAGYFEETAVAAGDPKAASNWISTEVLREVKDPQEFRTFPVRPVQLGKLIDLIGKGTISGKIAKDVFQRMCETGDDPERIVEQEDLGQISGGDALAPVVQAVVSEFKDAVEDYRSGNIKVRAFLVGKVMQKTSGRANPEDVNTLLSEVLESKRAS